MSDSRRLGFNQLVQWYLSPVGALFGLGLLAAILATVFDRPRLALVILIADVALLIPWKLARQRNELREHINQTAAANADLDARVERTIPRKRVRALLRAERKAEREKLDRIRVRIGRLEDQHGALAEEHAQTHAQTLAHTQTLEAEAKRSDARLERHTDVVREVSYTNQKQTRVVETLTAQVRDLEAALHDLQRDQADASSELRFQIGTDQRFVFGLGTGRSGTVSLSRLLDSQPSSSVGHEMRPLLPWEYDQTLIDVRLDQLQKRPTRLAGDVAYYYLPYVRHIATRFPDATFVCMRRNREAVIDSQMRKTLNYNLWADHDGSEWDLNEIWDPTMPSYEPMPKQDAIARYWDEYNEEALRLSDELGDRFEIFDLEETFDDEEGIRRLLDHVGLPRNEQNVVLHIHENAFPQAAD